MKKVRVNFDSSLANADWPKRTDDRLETLFGQKAKRMAVAHAPKGGVTLNGKFFVGGEFIPGVTQAEVDSAAAASEDTGESYEQAVSSWKSSLTSQDKGILKWWGASGIDIRKDQRDGKDSDRLRQWKRILDSAPKFQGTVHRGLSGLPFDVVDKWVTPGTVITLHNDQSSSKQIWSASPFYGKFGLADRNNVLWIVDQSSGADLAEETAVYYGDSPQTGARAEFEVVMRKGSSYEVVSAEYKDKNGEPLPDDFYEDARYSEIAGMDEQIERLENSVNNASEFLKKRSSQYKQNVERLAKLKQERDRLASEKWTERPAGFNPARWVGGHWIIHLKEL